jgi:3-oxoadipate enol-lactonase
MCASTICCNERGAGLMVALATMGDGVRIAYRWDGSQGAPVLLLSNSLGTDFHMWDPQIQALARHFRVLRYDVRGHGQSDTPGGAYSIDRLGRDVLELLEATGVVRTHFCGLSLGGMIGQWLAVRAPENIDRLVLANTSAYMGPPSNWQTRIDTALTEGMTSLAEGSLARWFTPAFLNRAPAEALGIRTMLLANRPAGYAGCCAAIRDMDQRATAGLNSLPTLVIAGHHDPATSVADGAFLAQSADDGRLVVLSGAHLSNVECADDFNANLLGFLGQGDGSRSV